MLDPEVAERLPEVLGELGPVAVGDFKLDQVAGLRRTPPPEVDSDAVECVDFTVTDVPLVTVRVRRPKQTGVPLACVYGIHGGGYIMGTSAGTDALFDGWCQTLGCVGVSVEYRLAPETPYPGPLDDCLAGLRWTHEYASELGVDADRIGVYGTSAGGGLAAGLSLRARDEGGPPIAFQLLAAPMIDDRQVTASSALRVPVWTPEANRLGWQAYLGERYGSDDVPPYAAPAAGH